MPRVLLIILLVPIALILAAAILIPMLVDTDKILAMAAEEVKKQSGAELVVSGGCCGATGRRMHWAR